MSGHPRRQGLGLVGLLLLLFTLAGIGLLINSLARQSGRASHWFTHAQVAHDLADAGIKQAYHLLGQASGPAQIARLPVGAGVFQQVYDAIVSGSGAGPFTLYSSADAASVPGALKTQLGELEADYSPTLLVTLQVLAQQPLFTGTAQGIPAMAGETRGFVQLVAAAAVQTPTGIRVGRTITVEKGFKVVSLIPPLLGRFSLFLRPQTAMDLNVVTVKFNSTSGNGEAAAGRPLVLKQPASAATVKPGAAGRIELDRGAFVTGLQAADFIDRQGWVFLGGPAEWKLRLAHGFTDAGETPLLTGDRFLFKMPDDAGFRQRYDTAFAANGVGQCATGLSLIPKDGLVHFAHAFASNYQEIGMSPPLFPLVTQGGARVKVKVSPDETCGVRLFGTPDALAPTLVFGPVSRVAVRRGTIHATIGLAGTCPFAGVKNMDVFRLDEMGGKQRTVIQAAFGSTDNFDRYGTNVEEAPYPNILNTVFDPAGSGTYSSQGTLVRSGAPGAKKTFTSRYFPFVAQLPSGAGIASGDLDALRQGKLAIGPLYTGTLDNGLGAFLEVIKRKATYLVPKMASFTKRAIKGNALELPGIVIIDEAVPLVLPRIDKVDAGGIVFARGDIKLSGDFRRTAKEPVTLVSIDGNIDASAAQNVEAYLITLAEGKSVKLAPGGFALKGGIAGRGFDVATLKAATQSPVVEYHPDFDPLNADAAYVKSTLRVFYGGDDRVIVSGETK